MSREDYDLSLYGCFDEEIHHGRIVKFTYTMPSGLSVDKVEKNGYVYIPYACSCENLKIVYFMTGAGTDLSKFVCEQGCVEDFLFKNFLDHGIEEQYISNTIVCFLSHCEGSPLTCRYNKQEEIQMARNFYKNFANCVIPKVEEEILPEILPAFLPDRSHRILSGFSFGGAFLLEALDEMITFAKDVLILSAYHLGKIENPNEDICEILESKLNRLQSNKFINDTSLIGITGKRDIAYKEMSYEFNLMKRMNVFSEGNLIFIENENGTHDYFAAAHYFLSGLRLIFKRNQAKEKN